MIKFGIRNASKGDESFLWEMLYHAIYVPNGNPPPNRTIIKSPELSKYVEGWGRKDDYALIATDIAVIRSVGAVWIRQFTDDDKGFGYVNSMTPEMTLAVLPKYRNQEIETKLLKRLFQDIDGFYSAISLSVDKDNPTRQLYYSFGFDEVEKSGDSLIMRKIL